MATATVTSFFKTHHSTATRAAVSRKRTGTTRKHHATISAATFDRLTVIQQIRRAFLPGARLAAWVGILLGGLIPVCTWVTAHLEVTAHPWHWAFVVGGLIYSAETCYKWARSAFGSGSKALGFVLLLEGTLTFGTILPLSLAALATLVFVNAISAACSLQVRKDQGEQRERPRASASKLTTLFAEGR